MIGRLWRALRIAAQLGCPRCGQRTLFRSMFSMNERCAVCSLTFEREPGYFIGAIYINYAVTTVASVTGFLLLDAYTEISLTSQLLIWGAFGIAFPVLFFRYSKSLWLAVGQLVNPEEPPVRLVHDRR